MLPTVYSYGQVHVDLHEAGCIKLLTIFCALNSKIDDSDWLSLSLTVIKS